MSVEIVKRMDLIEGEEKDLLNKVLFEGGIIDAYVEVGWDCRWGEIGSITTSMRLSGSSFRALWKAKILDKGDLDIPGSFVWEYLRKLGVFLKIGGKSIPFEVAPYILIPLCLDGHPKVKCRLQSLDFKGFQMDIEVAGETLKYKVKFRRNLEDILVLSRGDPRRFGELFFLWLKGMKAPSCNTFRLLLGEPKDIEVTELGGEEPLLIFKFEGGEMHWIYQRESFLVSVQGSNPHLCKLFEGVSHKALFVCSDVQRSPTVLIKLEYKTSPFLEWNMAVEWEGGTFSCYDCKCNRQDFSPWEVTIEDPLESPIITNPIHRALIYTFGAREIRVRYPSGIEGTPHLLIPANNNFLVLPFFDETPRWMGVLEVGLSELRDLSSQFWRMLETAIKILPKYRGFVETLKNLIQKKFSSLNDDIQNNFWKSDQVEIYFYDSIIEITDKGRFHTREYPIKQK